jgi:hypothetical protein
MLVESKSPAACDSSECEVFEIDTYLGMGRRSASLVHDSPLDPFGTVTTTDN